MKQMKMIKKIPMITLAASATIALSACGPEEPPVPEINTDISVVFKDTGALLQPQVDEVSNDTFAALEKASDDLKIGDNIRVGGDWAMKVLTAEYAQSEAKVENAIFTIPSELQVAYVTSDDTFPRIMIGVSTPEEGKTPWMGLWVQDDINTPYQLRNWADMIPGAELPEMSALAVGAPQVDNDDTVTGAYSPSVAVEKYVELLNGSSDKEVQALFEDDTYRDQLKDSAAALTKAVKEADGTYKETFTADTEHIYALQSHNGGYLVTVPISMTSTMTVKDATLKASGKNATSLLDGKLDDTVKYTYEDLLIFYVPDLESEDLISLVAVSHNLVSVAKK